MEHSPEEEIRARIASSGPMTFAEFMELALYHPRWGYYTRSRERESHSDYYTSPVAHPAFGALLAVHLEAMWEALGRPDPFHAVEMGAGSGVMARDVSEYARENLGEFADAMRYVMIDRSAPGGMDAAGVVGCVVSNELVDAFPVHRFEMRSGRLVELFVDVGSDGRLGSAAGEPSTPLLAQRLEDRGVRLPDGARGEINLRIGAWAGEVARILDRGYVVTIDYGDEAQELYSPRRSRGTLQTYFKHTSGSSPYQWIGRQDITARVDFTTVVEDGRAVGLRPLALLTQAEYLNRLGLGVWIDGLRGRGVSDWTWRANAAAMRGLADPNGLGGFKVLLQEKGVRTRCVDAVFPSARRVERLRAPLILDGSAQASRGVHWTGEAADGGWGIPGLRGGS